MAAIFSRARTFVPMHAWTATAYSCLGMTFSGGRGEMHVSRMDHEGFLTPGKVDHRLTQFGAPSPCEVNGCTSVTHHYSSHTPWSTCTLFFLSKKKPLTRANRTLLTCQRVHWHPIHHHGNLEWMILNQPSRPCTHGQQELLTLTKSLSK